MDKCEYSIYVYSMCLVFVYFNICCYCWCKAWAHNASVFAHICMYSTQAVAINIHSMCIHFGRLCFLLKRPFNFRFVSASKLLHCVSFRFFSYYIRFPFSVVNLFLLFYLSIWVCHLHLMSRFHDAFCIHFMCTVRV